MLTISYYLNSKYYGTTSKTNSTNDLQQQLEDNNIDYYLVWDSTINLNLSDYHEITHGKTLLLEIYKRN